MHETVSSESDSISGSAPGVTSDNWERARYPQRRPWVFTKLDSQAPADVRSPADRARYIPFRRRLITPDSPVMIDAAPMIIEARKKYASGEEPTLHELVEYPIVDF